MQICRLLADDIIPGFLYTAVSSFPRNALNCNQQILYFLGNAGSQEVCFEIIDLPFLRIWQRTLFLITKNTHGRIVITFTFLKEVFLLSSVFSHFLPLQAWIYLSVWIFLYPITTTSQPIANHWFFPRKDASFDFVN